MNENTRERVISILAELLTGTIQLDEIVSILHEFHYSMLTAMSDKELQDFIDSIEMDIDEILALDEEDEEDEENA